MINYMFDANWVYHVCKKSIPKPISKQVRANTKKIGCDVDAGDSTLTISLISLKDGSFESIVVDKLGSQAQLVHPVPSLQPQLELEPQQPFFSFFSGSSCVEPFVLWIPSYLLSLSWMSLSFLSFIFSILAYFLFLIFYLSSMISCFIFYTYLGSTSIYAGFSSTMSPYKCHSKALVIFMMTYLLNQSIFTKAIIRDKEWWPSYNFWYVQPDKSLPCVSQTH